MTALVSAGRSLKSWAFRYLELRPKVDGAEPLRAFVVTSTWFLQTFNLHHFLPPRRLPLPSSLLHPFPSCILTLSIKPSILILIPSPPYPSTPSRPPSTFLSRRLPFLNSTLLVILLLSRQAPGQEPSSIPTDFYSSVSSLLSPTLARSEEEEEEGKPGWTGMEG